MLTATFSLTLLLLVAALIVLSRTEGRASAAGVDVVGEYERLSRAYHGTCVPYKLYPLLGKTAPPVEEARFVAARDAFAAFMVALDGRRFADIAVHLERRSIDAGNFAPFDHVCEFLHEEQQRIRSDVREVDGHGTRFVMGFVPKYPLYVPFRPALRA